jgi:hypothetical protein
MRELNADVIALQDEGDLVNPPRARTLIWAVS